MLKLLRSLFTIVFLLTFTAAFSQTTQIDSLKNLIHTIIEDKNAQIGKAEVQYKTAIKEVELEKAVLEKKLQEQQLAEANFQLTAILFISIITVAFIITFYFLKSKRIIAEREAQKLLVEAIEKRLVELHLNHEGTETQIDISQINQELIPPLTENELETLRLSLEGLTNSEVAEKLSESIEAVKFDLRNVYKKIKGKGKKKMFNYITKSS